MNSSYALEHNCALLEQSKTLETLFRLTCGHGDADAALFLENGEEKRWSYRQYEAMTRQYAACRFSDASFFAAVISVTVFMGRSLLFCNTDNTTKVRNYPVLFFYFFGLI